MTSFLIFFLSFIYILICSRATVDIYSIAKVGKKDMVIILFSYVFISFSVLTDICFVVGDVGRCQIRNDPPGIDLVQFNGRSCHAENGMTCNYFVDM